MTHDPVKQIKEEEAKASQQIDSLSKENINAVDEHRIKKEKELEAHKEELRKKGQESLETAKKNAMTKFKEITDEQDRYRTSVIQDAEGKKEEAVKSIVSAFEKHLA